MGYHPGTHASHEKKTDMKRRHIARFCEFTGVDIRWLVAGTTHIKIGLTTQEVDDLIAVEDRDPKRRPRPKRSG